MVIRSAVIPIIQYYNSCNSHYCYVIDFNEYRTTLIFNAMVKCLKFTSPLEFIMPASLYPASASSVHHAAHVGYNCCLRSDHLMNVWME